MKKTVAKRIVQLIFIALTLWTLWYLNLVLSVKSWHGIDQTRALYYQPRNTIDVVMLGSSRIHCGVNTATLWEEYGIAAYDYSSAEQPMWNSYYYLREFCKYQKPKVVVVDLFMAAYIHGDYHYDWIHQNLYGVRFSPNKVRMLFAAAEPARIPEYFPSFFNYHDRYDEATKEDFLYPFTARRELAAFKGYTPYLNRVPQERPVITAGETAQIGVKTEHYLVRIIEYCQSHDIGLVLMVTPYITNAQDQAAFDRIEAIAAEKGVPMINGCDKYDEIGLDFETDFNDGSHLNYWGASKYTSYLGRELTTHFALEDHRGDPRYASWDDNASEIRAYVEEHEGEEVIVW